ncbi:hypothetical protein A2691_01455 [Candidatus Woesebacteria bacterium RIFCSPHIGHO2_01_FULL_39_23]|nr:MAG: hypothetical protein A2691_01455 [Candidatus Woesebacteria bacterium RIFCSPHIGHO2_01_FULL_39_23]
MIVEPFFTNRSIEKMEQYHLTENQVMDVFRNGYVDDWEGMKVSTKKYFGYEIRVFWNRTKKGKYNIISVLKRKRR